MIETEKIKLKKHCQSTGRHCSAPVQPPDWKHLLYTRHERCYSVLLDGTAQEQREMLLKLEQDCVNELQSKLDQEEALDDAILQLGELFEDAVEAELRFYK